MKFADHTYTTDKTNWGEGPWQEEADQGIIQFIDSSNLCLFNRNEHFGSLNGYVLIQPENPYFGMGIDDFDNKIHLAAYGGITWASPQIPFEITIFQSDWISKTYDLDNLWCVGFDFSHGYPIWVKPNIFDQFITDGFISETFNSVFSSDVKYYKNFILLKKYLYELDRALSPFVDGNIKILTPEDLID